MTRLVFSCEHAVNFVPEEYRSRLKIPENVLSSHRGYDLGARAVCQNVAREFSSRCVCGNVSRLVIDLNRSLPDKLFSEYSKKLGEGDRRNILEKYYLPYRNELESGIADAVGAGKRAIHLSIHSFTPVFAGVERRADFGILYDPRRAFEKTAARGLAVAIRSVSKSRVRLNYPYRGTSDGFTTSMRKKTLPGVYAGIEIEINQRLLDTSRAIDDVSGILARAIGQFLELPDFSG